MAEGRVARAPAPAELVRAAMRASTPRALAVVARRIGDFHDAEDAVQEALAEASVRWPADGIPDSPTSWLVTVASRRAVDAVRSDVARRERERRFTDLEHTGKVHTGEATTDADDTLVLYLLCCHPALTRPMQVALTLRCVGGLTTREIARGLLLTDTAVGQRVSRAKAALRAAGAEFALPRCEELPARVTAVLDVLSIVHTEAHSATEGEEITRPALGVEARRLTRELLARTGASAPWRGELMGLLALMLLTDARSAARTDPDGRLVPLAEQDRSLWRWDWIAEGEALLAEALPNHPIGPFQLKAAIAGVHSSALSYDATDWLEILGLYDLLRTLDPSPVVELGRLVALAEVGGPDTALGELDALVGRAPAERVAAVRAHLLTRAGRDASAAYRAAASLATNGAERRWLESRAG